MVYQQEKRWKIISPNDTPPRFHWVGSGKYDKCRIDGQTIRRSHSAWRALKVTRQPIERWDGRKVADCNRVKATSHMLSDFFARPNFMYAVWEMWLAMAYRRPDKKLLSYIGDITRIDGETMWNRPQRVEWGVNYAPIVTRSPSNAAEARRRYTNRQSCLSGSSDCAILMVAIQP